MDIIIHIAVEAGILLLAGILFKSKIKVENIWSALIAAIVIGILNASLGTFMNFIFGPVDFITLGLAGLLINAFVLKVADWLLSGLKIKGFLWAIILSLFLSLGNWIFL